MILRSACSSTLRIAGKTKSLSDFRTAHLLKSFGVQPCEQSRELSEKFRDPKDYRRYVGRPDDPPKKRNTQKFDNIAGRKDENKGDEKSSQNRKASDVTNPGKWTGRPERTCVPKASNDRSGPGKADGKPDASQNPKRNKFTSVRQTPLFNPGSAPTISLEASASRKAEPPPGLSAAVLRDVPSQKSAPPCLTPASISHNSAISLSSVSEIKSNDKELKLQSAVDQQNLLNVGEHLKSASSPTLGVTSTPGVRVAPKLVHTEVNQKKQGISLAVDTTREVQFAGAVSTQRPAVDQNKRQEPSRSPANETPLPKSSRVDIKIPSKLKFTKEGLEDNKRHRVYACGLTETGALGLYKQNEGRRWRKYIPRPLRHQFSEENRVILAESGYGFTLFYVKNDDTVKLFGCGLNDDFQLGPADGELISYPIPVDIQIRSPKTKILSMSAGRAHSVVATDNEGVFLFGSNSYGQCGRAVGEEDSSECTITQIKTFGGEKVASVQCGQDHSCFITETGKVYACGWGSEGQTGQGHTQHVPEPTIVEGDVKYEKIVKLAGKCDTVLALSDKGELFGWGSNEFRQIKDNQDWAQVDSPLFMEQVRKLCGKIVDVAAGSSFCCVLNEEGDVFVWGYGILGGGPELSKTAAPTLLPRTLFGANEYNPKAHPVKVYCGVDHMAAMNNLKHVYAWGKNKHGCLGIGTARDQYFPYKLAFSADAVHVSCAVDHTIIVTGHE